MLYFDKDRISQLLNITKSKVLAIMITMGKMDKSDAQKIILLLHYNLI